MKIESIPVPAKEFNTDMKVSYHLCEELKNVLHFERLMKIESMEFTGWVISNTAKDVMIQAKFCHGCGVKLE